MPNFWGFLEEIIRQEVRCWLHHILPKPDPTIVTTLSQVTITPLRSSPMPQQDFHVTLANDNEFGYEASPVVSLNGRGVQITDVPTLSTSDPALGTITFIAPTRYWIQLPDSGALGSVVTLSGDFDPAQTSDNFSFTVTIGADNITTDVGGVTLAPLTAPPV